MEFIFVPIIALMSLMALGILALVAIVALIKHRPGIVMLAGGLLLVALFIPAGLIVSYARMQAPGPFADFGGRFDGVVHETWHKNDIVETGKMSFVGILIIVGAALALLAALARRPASGSEGNVRAHGGRWWPALLILPLIFFFFIGTVRTVRTVRIKESQHHALAPPNPHPHHHQRMEVEATLRQQEQELARQMAEIRRRIDRMDIHELMDQFDAPRIVISGPRPAAIPWLALAELAASGAARIGEVGSGDESFVVELDHAEPTAEEKQLQVEAAAAVELIAGEESPAEVAEEDDISTEANASASAEAASDTDGEKWASASVSAIPAAHAAEAELSAPIRVEDTEPKVDMNRPEWVKSPPKRVGEVQRERLVTEEWSTESECERERDVLLLLKTYEHVQQLVGVPYQALSVDTRVFAEDPADHRLHQLQEAGITRDFVRREIAKDEYLETVERSVGPMMKLYTLVEFSPSVDRELRVHWDGYRRQERLAAVGFGASGILGLLGLTYGLLKVDTWTKGYYTKRLFLCVPAAIICLMALLALAVELN